LSDISAYIFTNYDYFYIEPEYTSYVQYNSRQMCFVDASCLFASTSFMSLDKLKLEIKKC